MQSTEFKTTIVEREKMFKTFHLRSWREKKCLKHFIAVSMYCRTIPSEYFFYSFNSLSILYFDLQFNFDSATHEPKVKYTVL